MDITKPFSVIKKSVNSLLGKNCFPSPVKSRPLKHEEALEKFSGKALFDLYEIIPKENMLYSDTLGMQTLDPTLKRRYEVRKELQRRFSDGDRLEEIISCEKFKKMSHIDILDLFSQANTTYVKDKYKFKKNLSNIPTEILFNIKENLLSDQLDLRSNSNTEYKRKVTRSASENYVPVYQIINDILYNDRKILKDEAISKYQIVPYLSENIKIDITSETIDPITHDNIYELLRNGQSVIALRNEGSTQYTLYDKESLDIITRNP